MIALHDCIAAYREAMQAVIALEGEIDALDARKDAACLELGDAQRGAQEAKKALLVAVLGHDRTTVSRP